jgi:hypothetical protein
MLPFQQTSNKFTLISKKGKASAGNTIIDQVKDTKGQRV